MIRHYVGLVLAPLAMTFIAPAAMASSDEDSCDPRWKIRVTAVRECSSTGWLNPGNDTRVNHLMLLHDKHGKIGNSRIAQKPFDDVSYFPAAPFSYALFASNFVIGKEEDDSGFTYGRCVSNESGAKAFLAELAKDKGVSAEDVALLGQVRKAVQENCDSNAADPAKLSATLEPLAAVKSKSGLIFADYLRAAAQFYHGDFDAAKSGFKALMKSENAWVKETSAYMMGRALLNRAAANANDEYGDYDASKADKAMLNAAATAFADYEKAYPNGRYASSAKGLIRRVYWYADDKERLIDEYVWQFNQKDPQKRSMALADLVQEMDRTVGEKDAGYDPAKIRNPHILAVLILKGMRSGQGRWGSDLPSPMARKALEDLRPYFKGEEALFSYLLAAHAMTVAKDPVEVLRLLPDKASAGGYYDFSRQMLRAEALVATKSKDARPALLALIQSAKAPAQREAAELALGIYDERNQGLQKVFAADSPIKDAGIRAILLRFSAGPDLLRAQASNASVAKRERATAIYTLLYKQLARANYAGFLKDSALLKGDVATEYAAPYFQDITNQAAVFQWKGTSEGYACPSLKAIATKLAAAPKDANALLCIGEFGRLNGFDPSDYHQVPRMFDIGQDTDELGGAPSQFAGKAFSRLAIYKGLIADPKVAAEHKSYALFRAINCFKSTGNNGCDSSEVAEAQRKAWFRLLKSQYGKTSWAQKLDYYW